MNRTGKLPTKCTVTLATCLVILFAVSAPAQISAAPQVTIESVVAVEEADGIYGRYRIVFTTRDRLPPPRDSLPDPAFVLDGDPVVLPPGSDRSATLHFGYFNELPSGRATLRAVFPFGPDDLKPLVLSQVDVDAAAMLARARPAPGEVEGSHIRRSPAVVDLWEQWTTADVVFAGTFVRNDIDQRDKNIQQRIFRVDEILRPGSGVSIGETPMFHAGSPAEVYELGGTYVVFASADPTLKGVDPDRYVAVRIWWPDADFVTEFLKRRAALGDLAHSDQTTRQLAVAFLTDELSSPAAEARRSAARELLRLLPARVALAPEQVDLVRRRLLSEPSPEVRAAFSELINVAPQR